MRRTRHKKKHFTVLEIIGIACLLIGLGGCCFLGTIVDAYEDLNQFFGNMMVFAGAIGIGAFLLKDSDL